MPPMIRIQIALNNKLIKPENSKAVIVMVFCFYEDFFLYDFIGKSGTRNIYWTGLSDIS